MQDLPLATLAERALGVSEVATVELGDATPARLEPDEVELRENGAPVGQQQAKVRVSMNERDGNGRATGHIVELVPQSGPDAGEGV